MRVTANRLGVLYRYFLILFIAIVTACAKAPVASAPATQQVVTVALPAALKPIAAAIKSCAANQPGISLFIDDPNNETSSASDLNLSLGEPVSPLEFSASLAVEDLVVLAHLDVQMARTYQRANLHIEKVVRRIKPRPIGEIA